MKIYFVDGYIDRRIVASVPDECMVVSGLHGISTCKKDLEHYKEFDYNVVANTPLALHNKYVWNEELGVPELYLLSDGEWKRIDELTNRKLTQAHNLFKLYLVGEFNRE